MAKLQLEGKHPCKVTFYLDNTTARDAATWLSTNWSVAHPEKPDIWTFPGHFGMTRAFQVMPLVETEDDRGRHLLTIGIDERTDSGWIKPFSVSDAGAANSRGIEILVIPVSTTQTQAIAQVIAACNALLLLHDFTDLLWLAKTAYGEKLRLEQRSFGVMDTPLFEDDPIAAEYYKEMDARFEAMLEAIEPPLDYLRPQNDGAHTADSETPRDDRPEGIDGGKASDIAQRRQDGLNPPPVPIDALKLSIMCQANTTARHLATALRNCGNRESEWIAHDCKDWPPRECTHYMLHRIDFEKPMDEDLTAVLSSILETKPKEREPTHNTAIRFHLQEISSNPARVKLNILFCLVGSQALRELGNTLTRLFRDVPEAAQTTKFFPHFWPERELPEHLEKSYNELTAWLKSKGGKEADPLIEMWGYDNEVKALETQERRQALYGEDGPAVNETPRDDGRAGIDGGETTTDSGKTVRTHIAERREQVAKLKARGMTYIEIAEALSVSRETVQDDLQAMGLTRGSRKG